MNIYPNTCNLQGDSKDLETGQVNFILSRLVKEPNNSSRNAKLIEHHLNDKILLSSSCLRFTPLGYDPENTVAYFQIVKNAIDYPTKPMLVKQGNGISL